MAIPRNLLQAIEEFYKRALRSYNLIRLAQSAGYSMPDDEDEPSTETEEPEVANPLHFDELMNISHQVDDPGLAQQLNILAELYRRAIQINGGYATIVRAINNLKDMYSDGEDSDIESILNGMLSELYKHVRSMGGLSYPDNPRFVQQLQQLKQDIELRDRDKQTEAEDSFQEEMNVPGAQGEGESDLTGAGLGTGESVFDPTAGIGGDKGDKVNRGWHTTGKAGTYKNWAEYYANEKGAYQADLSIETNPATRKTLQELIEKVTALATKTEAAIDLKNQLKLADDPAQQAQLDKLIAEISKLKKERTNLKKKIRSEQIAREKQRLEDGLEKVRDPKEKMLLQQKVALQNLSLSNNVGKAAERNARLALIAAMSGGNFPGEQTLRAMLDKIEEAKRGQIPYEQYRLKYEQRDAEKFRNLKVEGDLPGLIVMYRQQLATTKNEALQAVKRRMKKNPALVPFKQAITQAEKSGDAAALQAAKTKEAEFLKQKAYEDEQVKKIIRELPELYDFRNRCEELTKSGALNKSNLDEGIRAQIQNLIQQGMNLTQIYKKVYPYHTPIQTVEKMVANLQTRI